MRTFDRDPLFRSTIGFDHLFGLLDETLRQGQDQHPPYDIARHGEDRYAISLAVAGFGAEDLTITSEPNVLTIEGRRRDAGEGQFLYRGIPWEGFRRRFSLADHVQVEGATLHDGVLTVALVREVPEAMKPRRIPIGGNDNLRLARKAA